MAPSESRTGSRLRLVVAVLALLGFVYLGRHYFSELTRMRDARWTGVAAIALIHVLTLWLQGATLRLGLRPFDSHISPKQGMALSVMSSYANLLLPRSGLAATAAFLKQHCRTQLLDYSSIVLFNGGLFVCTSSLLALAMLAVQWLWTGQGPAAWVWVGLPILGLTSGLAVGVRWRHPQFRSGLGSQLLTRLCHATGQLSQPGNLWPLAGLHVLMTLLRAARLYAAFWALDIAVSPCGVLLASALGDLAFVFAFTPAALGFREAAITFAATALATTSSLALSVAIFDRIVFSSTVVVLAQIVIARMVGRGRAAKLQPAQHCSS